MVTLVTRVVILAVLVLGEVQAVAQETGEAGAVGERAAVSEAALRLHRSALVVDGHNDLPWKIREKGRSSFAVLDISKPQPQLHTDLPRLVSGGVGAQFWSVWVPPDLEKKGGATRTALEQIDIVQRMIRQYPDVLEQAYSAADVVAIRARGKVASLIGIEGGHTLENSLGVLRVFYGLGARYLTLTHTDTTQWADSATDAPRHGGLTEFGEQVVQEMNRLGMLVDISHVSVETMHDVLRISRAPVIASHSSAFALAAHPRNIPDEVLLKIRDNDGVVMVNFFSGFIHPEGARVAMNMFDVLRKLRAENAAEAEITSAMEKWHKENPMPRGNVATVVDHIDHIAKVAGIDHVGLGSDFDGISITPEGLEDVSCFPHLTQEMLRRGYGEEQVRKVLGENVMRALRGAEAVAANPP